MLHRLWIYPVSFLFLLFLHLLTVTVRCRAGLGNSTWNYTPTKSWNYSPHHRTVRAESNALTRNGPPSALLITCHRFVSLTAVDVGSTASLMERAYTFADAFLIDLLSVRNK
ncbi:hypothetical protein TSMEX_003626 [Taenia solium]|eukprot:TsM_001030000 transcript=TsM_001030000 gene=TsM_001030000